MRAEFLRAGDHGGGPVRSEVLHNIGRPQRLGDSRVQLLFTSVNHRLAKRKHLTLGDLVQERWATGAINGASERRLSQAFGDIGLPPPNVVIETTDLPLRQHMVSLSDFLAFASRNVARYAAARFGIVELRVKDLAITRRGGVVYRKDAYLPPVGRRFIEILKATAKEIAEENR